MDFINDFEELVNRIERPKPEEILLTLSQDLLAIDISSLSIKSIELIEKISPDESFFFELAVLCKDKSYSHPEWSKLSGRVKMLHIKRSAPKSFLDVCTILQNVMDPVFNDFCIGNYKKLDEMIDKSYDWIFDIFAVETLHLSYLAKNKNAQDIIYNVETPQYMYLRVAAFLWQPKHTTIKHYEEAFKNIERCYLDLASGKIGAPSPMLFNAGMKRPQMASCFLLSIEDDMRSICKSWHDSAIISMNNGGLGICFDALRHSEIANHGLSQGIVPWAKIENEILATVNQGGKRKGSGTMYICDWHRDIFEYVDLRDPLGKEELRARDLFYGIMISDLFMQRVCDDQMWSLFCPAKTQGLEKTFGKVFEEKYLALEKRGLSGEFTHTFRQVKARDLWKNILSSQIKTGMPFTVYKDAVNRKSNQKNLGTIRTSNLCVSGDTFILTSKGQIQIEELVDQKVKVWNGKEWSKTTVRQTSPGADLLKIITSDGSTIECTPEHKFYTQKSYHSTKPVEIPANKLEVGMKLIKFDLPEPIEFEDPEYFLSPYTHGFFCGDGTTYPSQAKNSTKIFSKIYLYGEKKELIEHLEFRSQSSHTILSGDILTTILLSEDIAPKFTVPHRSSISDRLRWFEGWCDADGCIARNGTNESLQVGSIEFDFLNEVRLMLQTLGIHSKIGKMRDAGRRMLPDGKGGMALYNCKEIYRLLVTSVGLHQLKNIGFAPKRLVFEGVLPQRSAAQFIKIVNIEEGQRNVPTFCFTEAKRHMGMFNGILTGQCVEINEYVDKDNIATCNLSSIPISTFVKYDVYKKPYLDFEELGQVTRRAIRNLGKVIELNYYPDDIPQIKYCNLRNRPIGVGIQDLAGCFAMMDICWGSIQAKQLNEKIARVMYYHGMDESVNMAEEYGAYETFPGSPASKGLFQFDLWEIEKQEKLGNTFMNLPLPCNEFEWNVLGRR